MNRSAGFTLVEMLVALAVTSLLMVAGSTLLIQTLRSGKMVETRTEIVRDHSMAHSLLREDLASATLRKTAAPDGLDTAKAFHGGKSAFGPLLAFTRSGWVNPADVEPRGDLQKVSYFLEDGRLVRRAWLRPDPVPGTPHVDHVLAENLDGVGLRFLSGDSWHLAWSAESGRLPDLVELSLVFAEGDELRQLFLVGGSG